MNTTRKRYKAVAVVLVLAAAVLGMMSCSKEDVISQNVWAFGIPLGGLRAQEAISLVETKASKICEGPLVFQAGERSCEIFPEELKVVLDVAQIRSLLDRHTDSRPAFLPGKLFTKGPRTDLEGTAGIVSPALGEVAEKIARALSRSPVSERYGFSGHDLIIYPHESGQVVTPEDVLEALERVGDTTVEVAFREVPADENRRLEPLDLVASCETAYKLEETDRNVNLELAAAAVHGQVLMPGETYSFNETAGERSTERGYRYANVVVGNTLVPDVGGGICQVTTTLFNAAAEGGLEFPEIHAHGIPVDYVSPGLDAAVAWNYLDLKVKNAFDHAVVFGAWMDEGNLLVRIYGKVSEKAYELEPVILEEYPEEGKNPGLLVETYRLEKQGGEVKSRQLLVRSYYLPSYPK